MGTAGGPPLCGGAAGKQFDLKQYRLQFHLPARGAAGRAGPNLTAEARRRRGRQDLAMVLVGSGVPAAMQPEPPRSRRGRRSHRGAVRSGSRGSGVLAAMPFRASSVAVRVPLPPVKISRIFVCAAGTPHGAIRPQRLDLLRVPLRLCASAVSIWPARRPATKHRGEGAAPTNTGARLPGGSAVPGAIAAVQGTAAETPGLLRTIGGDAHARGAPLRRRKPCTKSIC